MKAIILEQAGAIDNLQMKEIDKPTPKENEVLVEVKAISLNPVDYKVRANDMILSMICGEERPVILGWDIAGVVVGVGENATKFKEGDKVFGMVNFLGTGNAYAEFVASPENHLALMPKNISFEEAAAATLAALTAYQAMKSKIKKGDKVFVHAGSGGVGHYAIQLAKHWGAHVTATSSGKNKEFVLSLGADEHIDYREQAFEEVASGMDYVLDTLGGDIIGKSVKIMNNDSHLVSIAARDFDEEVQREANAKNAELSTLMVLSNGEDMEELSKLLESGAVKSHVSNTFQFDEIGEGHLALESGRTVGKIVVTI